tara:strand:- start:221 stop:1705 length:1485 start_codon:yes stop_codon:yes gene_type:complete
MKWETVVGLEVHTQLLTKSKLFSGASTLFGGKPNSQACAIDLALPGVLPVLNRGVVELAIKFGLAIDAKINSPSIFARKNYFYPDLPKGYQISQYEIPIVEGGYIKVHTGKDNEGYEKIINITRAHLEEDAGKSLHEDFNGMTGIDLNRAGTPLLEIVSEPDMRSSEEAVAFAKAIHALVRWIGISDGNMEEGSFRCDANVSVRRLGDKKLGTRREIKNLNSFRFLQQAIECEIESQKYTLETGGSIQQATVLFDSNKRETHVMRTKEDAHDYRYFPDPDLRPLRISSDWIEDIRSSMIESPDLCFSRFIDSKIAPNGKLTYALSKYDASILTTDIDTATYFEDVVKIIGREEAKLCANWVIEGVIAHLNQDNKNIIDSPVSPQQLAGLILRICDNTISGKTAKDIFNVMWVSSSDISADIIIKEKGLKQISDDSEITQIVDKIISKNSQQVTDFCQGKEKALNFLVGQVMKETKGKANPSQVNAILRERIEEK